MNISEDDKLGRIFKDIETSGPSYGFEDRLMRQISALEEKKSRRKGVISLVAIMGGIVAIFGMSFLAAQLIGVSFNIDLSKIENALFFDMPEVRVSRLVISIAVVSLSLLIGDLLIRRRIREKKYKD